MSDDDGIRAALGLPKAAGEPDRPDPAEIAQIQRQAEIADHAPRPGSEAEQQAKQGRKAKQEQQQRTRRPETVKPLRQALAEQAVQQSAEVRKLNVKPGYDADGLALALEDAGIEIRYDQLEGVATVRIDGEWRPFADQYEIDAMWDHLHKHTGWRAKSAREEDRCWNALLGRRRHNALLEWCKTLPKQTTPICEHLIESVMHVSEDHQALARDMTQEIIGLAIYRNLRPGWPAKRAPLLHSLETDVGKSQYVTQLGAPVPVRCSSSYKWNGSDDRKHIEQTRGLLIVEHQELAGVDHRNIDQYAAMLSTSQETVRLAYGRREQQWQARHVFVPTTNKSARVTYDQPAFAARVAVLPVSRHPDAPDRGFQHQDWIKETLNAEVVVAAWAEMWHKIDQGWQPGWSPEAEKVMTETSELAVSDPDEAIRITVLEKLKSGNSGVLPKEITITRAVACLDATGWRGKDPRVGRALSHKLSPYFHVGQVRVDGQKQTVYRLKDDS